MNYAFKEENRINEALAETVTEDNKQNEYFCPTPHCAARLTIRSINGNRTPYFAAKPNFPHSDFCRIHQYKINLDQYDEDRFNLDDFMNNLLQARNGNYEHGNYQNADRGEDDEEQIKPVTTVCQLYSICIRKSIHQHYHDMEIAELLVDRRTRHIYKYYIEGIHLVECEFWRFERQNNLYFARYWLDDAHNQCLTLKLCCNDEITFNNVFDKIFQKHFVIAGIWFKECKGGSTNIINGRQIYSLKE